MFAIENIDPRVGRIKVTKVSWDNRESETKKEKQVIEMIDCKEYQEGGKYASFDLKKKKTLIDNINVDRLQDSTFLCPKIAENESLNVQGHFGSKMFQYVKLKIEGCDLGDKCFSDE